MKSFLRICLLFIMNLIIVCANFEDNAIFEDEDIYGKALTPVPYSGMIIPGTKWCGPGNSSTSYDDLGRFRETDKCCRAHDHCPGVIEPRESLHGLFNPDMFPRMACECEQEFLNCLQKVDDFASSMVGRGYFGARSVCFKNTHPAIECIAYQQGMIGRRCIKYRFEKTKPRKWQFFEVPYFTSKQ